MNDEQSKCIVFHKHPSHPSHPSELFNFFDCVIVDEHIQLKPDIEKEQRK